VDFALLLVCRLSHQSTRGVRSPWANIRSDSRCLISNKNTAIHRATVPSYHHSHQGVFTDLAAPLIACLETQVVDVSGLIWILCGFARGDNSISRPRPLLCRKPFWICHFALALRGKALNHPNNEGKGTRLRSLSKPAGESEKSQLVFLFLFASDALWILFSLCFHATFLCWRGELVNHSMQMWNAIALETVSWRLMSREQTVPCLSLWLLTPHAPSHLVYLHRLRAFKAQVSSTMPAASFYVARDDLKDIMITIFWKKFKKNIPCFYFEGFKWI